MEFLNFKEFNICIYLIIAKCMVFTRRMLNRNLNKKFFKVKYKAPSKVVKYKALVVCTKLPRNVFVPRKIHL